MKAGLFNWRKGSEIAAFIVDCLPRNAIVNSVVAMSVPTHVRSVWLDSMYSFTRKRPKLQPD